MSHPGSQGCDIDLSSANVLEILLAYRAFRQTLNASYSNENIVRNVRQLEKEFSCTLVPSQITDIFYANFIQWAHEGGNCYSTIKLYCNLLKAALVWASRHGCGNVEWKYRRRISGTYYCTHQETLKSGPSQSKMAEQADKGRG